MLTQIKLWAGGLVAAIVVAWAAWFWHHYNNLKRDAAKVPVLEEKIKVVHDVKVIREQVRAVPDTAIDGILSNWYRD